MTITPKSAKIPQWSVGAVTPIAEAISDLAGPASNARIAQQLGVSPAGGKFRSKLGTAGHYGLTRRENGLHVLTERGEALLSSDEEIAMRARREAVMSTTFGHVIRKFIGREPNEAAIAARLEDDYGVPAASAAYQATTLVEAAREAVLISNGRFDAATIESVPLDVASPAPGENGSKPRADATEQVRRLQRRGRPAEEKEDEPDAKTSDRSRAVKESAPPFAPSVRVVLNVDASAWTPNQVAELIRSLHEPEAAASSQE